MEDKNYFASEDPKRLAEYLFHHIQNWGSESTQSSVFSSVVNTWRRNLIAYYSPMINAQTWQSSLGYVGQQGEYVSMVVPVARTLIRQLVAIICKQRLAIECLTDITDSKGLQTARLGKAVCNDDIEQNHLEKKLDVVTEQMLVTGMGYLTCTWRTDKGFPYSANDDGSVNYSGSNTYETPDCRDVIFDWSIRNQDDWDWVIIRQARNRWDLVSQHPELEDRILAQPSVQQSRQTMGDVNYMSMYQDTERIFVYEFYYKPSPSLPKGRMTFFLEDRTTIYDDVNLYECLPIYQFKCEDIMGTGLGYPLLSSLLPAQEMMDHGYSVQATNQASFGVQSVLVPKGSDISAQNIEGLNFISYKPAGADGGGKPEPLQLTSTPPEIPAFCKEMERLMESNASLNSALRGNPQAGVTAGTAIATLSANALEFVTPASKVVLIGLEKILMIGLLNYRRFAKIPRFVCVLGDQDIYLAKEFLGEDLKSIKRVKIRTQSPLMNSVSGRTQVADSLLQAGIITDPQAYIGLIEGQPVEALFHTELNENVAVQSEADALLEGKPIYPMITDNHPRFIRKLQSILYNADVRGNPELTQVVTDVIFERARLEQQLPPDIKAMLRTGMAPQGGPPPPPGGQPPPEGTVPGGDAMMGLSEASAKVAQPAVAPASV